MPKYSLPLQKITPQDSDQFGKQFASLGEITLATGTLPKGLVIGHEAFTATLAPHWQQIDSFLGSGKPNAVLVGDLRELLLEQVKLPNQLLAEINLADKNLKLPLQIEVVATWKDKEILHDHTIAFDKKKLQQQLIESFLAFLDPILLSNSELKNNLEKIKLTVLISQKEHPEVSGTTSFTGSGKNILEIKAIWGELNNQVSADSITLDVNDPKSIQYTANKQAFQLILNNGVFQKLPVAAKYQAEKKLKAEQISEIVKVLKSLRSQLLANPILTFSISDRKVIYHSLTTKTAGQLSEQSLPINLKLITTLRPLFPRMATGVIKHVGKISDFAKIKKGEIAVIDALKKEHLRFLKKASGVIIRRADSFQKDHSHLIDQLGIGMAIGDLNSYLEGVVTLDGKTGKIYRGSFFPLVGKILEPNNPDSTFTPNQLKTATKVFAYTGDSTKLKSVKAEAVDGIGPIRIETLLTKSGHHPDKLLEQKNKDEFAGKITTELADLCSQAGGKAVIYQLTDFKSSDLLHLKGAADQEKSVLNPLLGLRGAQRSLENQKLLDFEINLIRDLRNKNGFKNIALALPFVRTLDEFIQLKKILSAHNLHRSASFKLYLSISIPANLTLLEEFASLGVDGFLFDYWELTNLFYGRDFTYQQLTQIKDPAIEKALESAVATITKKALFSALFNIPLSTENDILKKLVKNGLKAVAIGPDLVDEQRKIVAQIENELVSKG